MRHDMGYPYAARPPNIVRRALYGPCDELHSVVKVNSKPFETPKILYVTF